VNNASATDHDNNAALVLAIARDQDRGAFTQLFQQMGPRLKAWCMGQGSTESEADDLVQECFIRVWNKAGQYRPETASANTWLFTIIRNCRIDALRKGQRESVGPADLWPEPSTGPMDEDMATDLNARHVRKWVSDLPGEQRQMLYKAFFEGKTHAEIAAETGVPLGTIKSRIRLALQKLDNLARDMGSWLTLILLTNF
jgi:RNA polymerase sigma-70 factor (ECF subfamily)